MSPRIPAAVVAPSLARQLTAGAVLLAVVLAGLAAWGGVGVVRGTAGVVLAVAGAAVLLRAARTAGARTLGPAGSVTLARGVLVVGVAALTGSDGAGRVALVVLASVALVLDVVDGPVARRTGTATALGARFDMETDALLLLVLSVHVALVSGAGWVVALGLMRYAYAAAGRVLPWLDGDLPVRRSAKVVAAVQGVVLVVAAARVLPTLVERAVLALALAALLWSFGTSVAHRWRVAGEHPFRRRAAAAGLLTVAAVVLVGGILVLPTDPLALEPSAFVRLPLEAVVGAAVLAVLPARPRRVVAVLAGVVLALVGVLKLLDLGFRTFLDRPFDPVSDRVLLGNAREFVQGAAGAAGAVAATIGAVAAVAGLLVATAWAVARLGGLAARHRAVTLPGAAVLAAAWLVIWAGAGIPPVPGVPLAAADGVAQVRDRIATVPAAIRDDRAFAAEAAQDAFAGVPADGLLTALRGKDVVFAVVESYGRSAVEDPAMAPRIAPVLAAGDRALGAAGFASRSGFLTAPISGGGSWLAHATLFSGLRIDDQGRHDRLTASDRLTLTRAFRDAGWETTAVMPGTTRAWPEASFYGHQRVHARDGLGYAGPPFSWSPMPDQYALAAFSRLEYDRPGRGPLLAEIALTSSHAPWTPVPPLLPWAQLGDGSVYAPHARGQRAFESIFSGDTAGIRADYLGSLAYSLRSLLGWVERSGAGAADPDDLVVVLLGDHQPVTAVTGPDAGRDVPISIVTRDRAVLDRVAAWGWTPGLRPPPDAPVWPMEDFRDRFLTAFGR